MTPIEEVKLFFDKCGIDYHDTNFGGIETEDIKGVCINGITKQEWDSFWNERNGKTINCSSDVNNQTIFSFCVHPIQK